MTLPVSIYIAEIDKDRIIRFVNHTDEGVRRDQVIGQPITSWVPANVRNEIGTLADNAFARGETQAIEFFVLSSQGERTYSAVIKPIKEDGRIVSALYTATDITERKYCELEERIVVEFLSLLNATAGTGTLIKNIVDFFQRELGCEAVGIRLREGNDYPYYETSGFSPEFVELENSLCVRCDDGTPQCDSYGNPVLECMCGNVISGRFDASKPFFTQRGSFWTNSTSELLASTTEADRQARTRNRCHGEGYESVALIPLVTGRDRLGLIQLNDHRRGKFSARSVAMLERLASYVATAIARSRAEDKLRESEERYRVIASSTPDHLLVHDRELRYTLVLNPQLGLTEQEMLGKTDGDMLGPEDAAKLVQIKRQVLATGVAVQMETSLTSRTGEQEFFQGSYVPKFNSCGDIDGLIGYFRNITDRKRAEEALRRSEERFRTLADGAFEGVCVSCNGIIRDCNRAFASILRYPPNELIGSDIAKFIPPESRDVVTLNIREGRDSHLQHEMLRKDGTRCVVEVRGRTLADGTRITAVHDITDRRACEQEAARVNRLYAALSELNQTVLNIQSHEGLFQAVCRIATQRAGFHLAWIGWVHEDTQRVTPIVRAGNNQDYLDEIEVFADDRPQGLGPTGTCIRENQVCVIHDFLNNPRTIPWKEAAAKRGFRTSAALPIRSATRVVGALTVYDTEPHVIQGKEITLLGEAAAAISLGLERLDQESHRRQAEAALQRSQSSLAAAQELAKLGSWEWDVLADKASWSDETFRIFEIPRGNLKRHRNEFLDRIHPEDRARVDRALSDALNGSRQYDLKYRLRLPGKRAKVIQALAEVIRDEGGQPVLMRGTVQDITEREEAEHKLRESEERFRVLFEQSPDGILIIDPATARFLQFNSAAHRQLGYSREEFARLSIMDVEANETEEEVKTRIARVIREGRVTFQTLQRTQQGELRTIHVTAQTVNILGHPAYQCIWRDITESKRAEEALRESEERFRILIEHASDGFELHDEDGRYVEANTATCKQLGYSQDELLRLRVADIYPLFSLERYRTVFDSLRGKPGITFETVHRRKDGTEFPVEVSTAVIELRDGPRALALVRDVTERKRIEAELVHAKDAAEAANRAKSEFLANMSHEIRTPMTAILGYADLLLESEATPPDHRECLQVVQRNGQSLLELINTILDLAKIESGSFKVDRRECSAIEMVDEIVSLISVQASKKGLSLQADYQYPLPQMIRTDPARLRQILLNLIGNAVKFTDRGGVRISVYLDDLTEGKWVLCFAIRDTGIGISAAQRDNLFRPFSQVDSSFTRKHGGTGLGLAISKRFAELLNGDIQVESEPGLGSTFTLRIDLGDLSNTPMLCSRPSMISSSIAGTARERLQGRVLLAEDGVDNQRVIRLLLEKAGLSVDLAENGLEACRHATCSLIEGSPYDVILMDIHMPTMDGYEATTRLRQLGWKRPIIALTANAMIGDRDKCLAAGCNEYLSKPISRQDLLAMIARFLPSETGTSFAKPRT